MSADTVKLECFFISGKEESEGFSFVAASSESALEMGVEAFIGLSRREVFEDFDVRILKDADILGLAPGMVEPDMDALMRAIYIWVYAECPLCHTETEIAKSEEVDVICCSSCEDRLIDRMVAGDSIEEAVKHVG